MKPDYIVGLIDGEGSFQIEVIENPKSILLHPTFRINLKKGKEEKELLEEIKDFLRVGSVHFYESYPNVSYCITGPQGAEKFRNFLEEHPPKLKEKEFSIWSEAVDITSSKDGSREERQLKLAEKREKLRREYGGKKGRETKWNLETLRTVIKEGKNA